jgi:hypothetical protein
VVWLFVVVSLLIKGNNPFTHDSSVIYSIMIPTFHDGDKSFEFNLINIELVQKLMFVKQSGTNEEEGMTIGQFRNFENIEIPNTKVRKVS